jgi:hypothetical protein
MPRAFFIPPRSQAVVAPKRTSAAKFPGRSQGERWQSADDWAALPDLFKIRMEPGVRTPPCDPRYQAKASLWHKQLLKGVANGVPAVSGCGVRSVPLLMPRYLCGSLSGQAHLAQVLYFGSRYFADRFHNRILLVRLLSGRELKPTQLCGRTHFKKPAGAYVKINFSRW